MKDKQLINQPRVLVIEDDDDFRQLLVTALTGSGMIVSDVSNGRFALDFLANQTIPDIILCDWSMPVVSGREFIIELRTMEHFSAVPVLLVTSTIDVWAEAKDIGFSAHVAKNDLLPLSSIVNIVRGFLKTA